MQCEQARAKLNLSLDVLGRLEDGYHELLMVMESVELCDEVELELRRDGEILLDANLPWLPRDSRNLAVKAVEVFRRSLGEEALGAEIHLQKCIPVGAGMAGGSTDAAAVLRALNAAVGRPYDADGLRGLALEVGSDVPYCICGGSALAAGRGEKLSPLPPMPECSVVIVKPGFSISTGELFGRIDSRRSRVRPDTQGLTGALEKGNLSGVARRMYNVFEDVLAWPKREIGTIRSQLLECGALGAVMTGTGSAVFGLFDDAQCAAEAGARLKRRYRDVYLTRFASPEVI